ncbi:50S ribosomal protein L11 methyltransferase [Myroides sp. LJL116]
MKYIGYHFTIQPKELGSEILLAELGQTAFESFQETSIGLSAYVQESLWTSDILEGIYILDNPEFSISWVKEDIAQVNWNAEWEKNFEPIDVDSICYVRAPFHAPNNSKYDVVIEPKMSFGTGHHETTFMMIRQILKNPMQDKVVLDMGCGTSILGILASMTGAKSVDAIDIDPWCCENSIENAQRNGCSNIFVAEGDASILSKIPKYDAILANINRNILLNDMHTYVDCLKQNGEIYFSGFYTQDIESIDQCAKSLGLVLQDQLERNNWVSLKYIKQ